MTIEGIQILVATSVCSMRQYEQVLSCATRSRRSCSNRGSPGSSAEYPKAAAIALARRPKLVRLGSNRVFRKLTFSSTGPNLFIPRLGTSPTAPFRTESLR